MHKISVTAIFDIGKTNKKFLLFDERCNLLYKHQEKLATIHDEDGDECDDLNAIELWVKENLKQALSNPEYSIDRLNFSTYGASLVFLDGHDSPVGPLYNYLKPYPEALLDDFYARYKDKRSMALETASPPMGMLNSALQIFWLKEYKSAIYTSTETILHFPQYLSFVFSGRKVSELTSIGCHTMMWNFEQQDYHHWMKQEAFTQQLPEITSSNTSYPLEIEGKQMEVGIGIHDSSSALVPYLYTLEEPFILVSTGTWSISFNPFNEETLSYEELQRDCLCYMNIYGAQVKSSRFFLGTEYSKQLKKIKAYFSEDFDEKNLVLDKDIIERLTKDENSYRKLGLEESYNSGPFAQDKPGYWDVSLFETAEEAYQQLMLDLVSIQAESIRLVLGEVETKKIVVTGGFSQNLSYIHLLASYFPDKEIVTSRLPNASALGAALVISKDSIFETDKDAATELLDLKPCANTPIESVRDYQWKNIDGPLREKKESLQL